MSGTVTWTAERIDLLLNRWEAGLSASAIARMIGDGVTRNAVIAKVHRLKDKGGARAPHGRASIGQQRPKQTRPPKPVVATAFKATSVPKPVAPYVEHQVRVFHLAKMVTFLELEDKHCRWPIGDPRESEFRFCGEGKVFGLPYCAGCASVAYAPPKIAATGVGVTAGGPSVNSGYLWPQKNESDRWRCPRARKGGRLDAGRSSQETDRRAGECGHGVCRDRTAVAIPSSVRENRTLPRAAPDNGR